MLTFLDFDGVVCDSAIECLASSWIAYYHRYRNETPDQAPTELRARFLALRPFIRGGPDFLVIQDLLRTDSAISTQEEFDGHRDRLGPQIYATFTRLLDQVRQELLRDDRHYWLELNRLFPHVEALLPTLDWDRTFILSTKRRTYIREILAHRGIQVPYPRVLHSSVRSKQEIIATLLDVLEEDAAVLIDDQRDHLLPVQDPRIQPRLALWGYVKPEWRTMAEPPAVSESQLAEVVQLL